MKKFNAVLVSILAAVMLAACGGGGGSGSTSTGGVYYTHAQLAAEFVYRLQVDLGYDIELVKDNTLRANYIVVYDYDYGTYDAYYIGGYNVGENLYNYLVSNESRFYYDLIPETGNFYYDPVTGTRFNKIAATGTNLTTMKAFEQEYAVLKIAKKVTAEYGLSEEAAHNVARFSYNIQTKPAGTFQVADYDNFAAELTNGSTITDFQNDFKAGNTASLADRIERAAQATGMSPENMNSLIQDMFMK
jgi:hypothetical protein